MAFYLWSATLDGATSKAIEHRLRAVIPDVVTIPDLDAWVMRQVKQGSVRSYLAAIVPSKDRRILARLTDFAARHRDWLLTILISDEISIEDYKMVTRTGGADWISSQADPREILDIIGRRQTRLAEARPDRTPERKSVVISFVPSAGGVGKTMLSVETGIHLKTAKATHSRNVCLIDLDFQSGHVCDYLDIEPRLQISEISTDPERLDAQLFDIFVSHHTSGLDVFAAPRTKFDYCDLDVAALDSLFSMAVTRYDLILVDLPVTWYRWTSKVIAASDAALVIGINTVPNLRQTAETLSVVRAIPQAPARLVVAINRCQRGLIGGIARRQHVETALGREQVFYLHEEPMALESINTGSPMGLTKRYRAIGKDIAALAAFCAGVTSARAEES